MVLSVADWAQTRYISRNPARTVHEAQWIKNPDGSTWGYVMIPRQEGFEERNPLLGKAPSTRKVDVYFLLNIAGHVAIARWLSPPNRRAFQMLTIGWEASFVAGNARIGVKMRW